VTGRRVSGMGEGNGGRTGKLSLQLLPHKAILDLVQRLEHVGGHDGFLAGCYCVFVCAGKPLALAFS